MDIFVLILKDLPTKGEFCVKHGLHSMKASNKRIELVNMFATTVMHSLQLIEIVGHRRLLTSRGLG